jgi:hypothetical protein
MEGKRVDHNCEFISVFVATSPKESSAVPRTKKTFTFPAARDTVVGQSLNAEYKAASAFAKFEEAYTENFSVIELPFFSALTGSVVQTIVPTPSPQIPI